MKKVLLLLFLFAVTLLHAEIKICSHCGQGIKTHCYTAENKYFCSKKCLGAKFSCSSCGTLPRGRYMISMATDGTNHRFCESCSKQKRCFSCTLPATNGRILSDDRFQCNRCSARRLTPQQTRQLLTELRATLHEMYGFEATHKIVLRLISQKAMEKISNDTRSLGCMKVDINKKTFTQGRKERTEIKWTCTLYLLTDLPDIIAAKVMAHELTHDYLYHHAGRGNDPKVTEGICEAVSGAFLESRKFNGYLEAMKKNPDPVYGAGFRLIFPQLKRYGFKGMLERYRSTFTPF